MEIISIEKKAFEEMVSKLNGFIAGIETLYLKGSDKKIGRASCRERV